MKATFLLSLILATLPVTVTSTFAEGFVSVTLGKNGENNSEELQSIHGILVQADKVTEVTSVQVNKTSSGLTEVKIPLPDSLNQDILVGAVGKKKSGEIVFSPLRSTRQKNIAAPLAIPECPKEAMPAVSRQIPVSEQLTLLDSIVRVRKDKKTQSLQIISGILSADLLERARALESSFGLVGEKQPLSASLPPVELVERLNRLNDAVRRYHQTRAAPENP